MAYSQDLRDRVLWALERGEGPTAIARRLEVSGRWIYRVKERDVAQGERGSAPVGGYRRSRVADKEGQIRTWVKAEAALTLAELCQRLAGDGISLSSSALWHQLDKWGLTFKKNSARQRAAPRRRAAGAPRLARQATAVGRRQVGLSR